MSKQRETRERVLELVEELEASRRKLDAAFELTRARQLAALIADIDRLDDDLPPDTDERRIA